MEAKHSKLRCWQGHVPSRASREGSFLPPLASGGHSILGAPWLHSSNLCLHMTISVSPLCLQISPFTRTSIAEFKLVKISSKIEYISKYPFSKLAT